MAGKRPVARAAKPANLIVAASLALCLAGCARVKPPVPLPDEPVDGYAWTAMLVSRHPLWGALQDLERAQQELGAARWEPALEPVERRFSDLTFAGSFALGDPGPSLTALNEDWRADYPPLLLPRNGLSQDLQARIDWERERAQRLVRDRMAAAESAESRELARMRAALVQYYQERLTNLSIDSTIGSAQRAAEAEAEAHRIWAIIEAEIDAARRRGEEDLAALEAELREQAAERVERASERAQEISTERRETMRAAGAELYDRMIAEMEQPWPTPDAGAVAAEVEAEPANARLGEMGGSHAAAETARQAKTVQQQLEMAEAIARLRAQIREGTETAAEVVAYRNGIALQVIPGGTRRGNDVTAFIAEELEDFWAVSG